MRYLLLATFILTLATTAMAQQPTGLGFFPSASCSPFVDVTGPEISLCAKSDGFYYNTVAAPTTFQKLNAGTPGPPGNAATVQVGTTTTLAPGTSATVNNSGSTSAAVLNFGIPQGAKGDTGAMGPAGAPGTNCKGWTSFKINSINADGTWDVTVSGCKP